MSKEIVTTEPGKELATLKFSKSMAMVPKDLAEAERLAKAMSEADIVPKEMKGKWQNCLVAIGLGAEVGLSPMQAIQNIMVVNGRPSIWGDAMLALCRAAKDESGHRLMEGFVEAFEGADDDYTAVATGKRRGEDPVTRRFSVADAMTAGLWGKSGPWTNYPGRMLQMRARSFLLRDVFPDVLKGLQVREEVMDYVETTATREAEDQRPQPLKHAPPPAAQPPREEAAVTRPATPAPGGPPATPHQKKAGEEEVITTIAEAKVLKKDPNGKWVLHHVTDGEGARYQTFDTKIYEFAKESADQNVEVRIVFQKNANPKYANDLLSIELA